ncbi:MAG: MerR family transcriptional regulator [Methylocystis sp.]|uniref:MerR family transcriptional regulator n=1 Tax=Methylocystis sp. TaxID=1911079 RepID=UPI003DA2FC4E
MAGRSATAREDIASLRTIGEVAEHLDLPQHVLRFWETRFREIDPVKRAGGRRYYRPRDIELVEAIRHLLYREGYTIKGVQRILKEQGVDAVIADVRRRQSGESPVASPAPDLAGPTPGAAASPEPRPMEAAFDRPDPEFPPRAPAPEPVVDAATPQRPATPPVPLEAPVFHPPVAVARPAHASQAQLLQKVLGEIGECRRLLKVTRR